MTTYFDELVPGQCFETATRVLTEADIVSFATTWDPQSFHLDHLGAEKGMFGKLAASGLQTLLISFRLCIDAGAFTPAAVAGLGLKNVTFHRPVFPNDRLQSTVSVVKMRASRSRSNLGIVWWHLDTRTQKGDVVLSMDFTNLLTRRPSTH